MWMTVVIIVIIAAAIWGFVVVAKAYTRMFTQRTDRTAESMYNSFSDQPRRQP